MCARKVVKLSFVALGMLMTVYIVTMLYVVKLFAMEVEPIPTITTEDVKVDELLSIRDRSKMEFVVEDTENVVDVSSVVPEPVKSEEEQLSEQGYIKVEDARTTGYCKCEKCCGKWSEYGLTASGVEPTQGVTVAADFSVLPVGTDIVLDGQHYTVQDKGGAIKGTSLDVYFDSHDDAEAYAVQYKTYYYKLP